MKMHKNIASDLLARELAPLARTTPVAKSTGIYPSGVNGCHLKQVASAIIVLGALSACSTPPPWVDASRSEAKPSDQDPSAAEKNAAMLPGPRPRPVAPPAAGPGAPSSVRAGVAPTPNPGSTQPNLATSAAPIASPSVVPEVPTARIYQGTGNFLKQTPPAPPAPAGPEEFSLQFESTDIRAIVQTIMGDYMRESFTIHPSTAGTATIRFSRPVSRKDLIPILEMLLRQNGQVMIREEGIYKIQPSGLGIRGATTPQFGINSATLPAGYSVQLVQLKFVGVTDMKRILEPYAVDAATSVKSDDIRNLLILSGTQRELKHLLDIVDLFDVDFLSGYSVGLFPMSTDVKALAGDLDRIFGTAAQSPLSGIVRIIPIERMNGLLVVTTQPRYLEEAKKWIERLDKSQGGSGGIRLNVYPVQHGKADKLAQLLGEVYGNRSGSTSQPTLAPGQRPAQLNTPPQPTGLPGQPAQPATPAQAASAFSGSGSAVSKDLRVIADIENNALLVLASPADYETIQIALKQLDVPRRQVKVEVLVAEVSLTDNLKFGIEWFIKSRPGVVGALRNTIDTAAAGTTGATTATLPRTPTLPANTDSRSVVPQSLGLQLIDVVAGDVRAVLQALGQDGKSQTLSTPNVTVLDNEKASINVGSQISVNTGSSSGTGGQTITTNSYVSTGVILEVTPRINAGGRVTLDINQEISTPGDTPANGGNPPITTRKAKTVVNVSSGETMVLAGLISNTSGSGSSGVPLLSKIPVLGGLFGTQTINKNRTELVILITPVVINNSDDSRAVMEELRKKLPGLQSAFPKPRPAADGSQKSN
jgi:general secretion pathway protein D